MLFTELKAENTTVAIKVNDATINVKQYLPINSKYNLVAMTADDCFMNGVFNPTNQELFFNVNLIYMYTDIEFTEEEREHPAAIYDMLEQNGVFNAVIAAIPTREMNMLYDLLKSTIVEKKEYNKSIAGALKSMISDLPTIIEEAGQQLNDFDINKYENVVNMAKAIGATNI